MFIPLYDANSLKYIKLQYVTLALIALNVIIFGLTSLAGADSKTASIGFGYIPSVAHHMTVLPPRYDFVPPDRKSVV